MSALAFVRTSDPTLVDAPPSGAIVQNEAGVSDYNELLTAMAEAPHRLVFFGFDLLHLDGMDMRTRPCVERRALLHDLLAGQGETSALHFSEAIEGSGARVFAMAEQLGLEGIVSKRAASRYKSGPSRQRASTHPTGDGPQPRSRRRPSWILSGGTS